MQAEENDAMEDDDGEEDRQKPTRFFSSLEQFDYIAQKAEIRNQMQLWLSDAVGHA